MIVPPIPSWLLDADMSVRVPDGVGGFRDPVAVRGVRFERVQAACEDGHRSADAGGGIVFVDALRPAGAFEIPVGSRVEIDGVSLYAARVERVPGLRREVHHWEVKVS